MSTVIAYPTATPRVKYEPMTFRVFYRQADGSISEWAHGLTCETAENVAALLRHWLPGNLQAAWTEPEWNTVSAR